MLGLFSTASAVLLLVLVTPVCAWVVFTDLKYMKIRNKAVLTLLAIFALAGPLVMPLDVWAWRWVHFVVIFGIGVFLNAIAHFGAGDAKFAAAAAPFFSSSPSSIQLMVLLLTAFILAAFTMHRFARMIPAARRMAPDWVSWTRGDFPLGLALAGTLWGYLAVIAIFA